MRVFLAGAEAPGISEILVKAQVPRILFSYYHGPYKSGFHRALASVLGFAKERFCDSGAFTFLQKGSAGGLDFDEYLAGYIKWVGRMSRLGLIDWWAEMDVGAVAGQDWVLKQRELWYRAGLGHGLLTVWHQEHDWDYWMRLLEQAAKHSRYVAIEGHQRSTRAPLNYQAFIDEAYRRQIRIHGFKMTSVEDLQKWPFYSVDSTTWQTGRWGSKPVRVRTGGFKKITRKVKNTDALGSYRATFRTDIKIGNKLDWFQGMFAAARTWMRVENELTDLWKLRGIDWETQLCQQQ